MISNLIVKVASDCNLACSYCYFARNKALETNQRIMPIDILYKTISRTADYCHKSDIKDFIFCWHGGEPLLAGYNFFNKVKEFQKELMPPNVKIENAIQTNGMLLDDRWVEMFKQHDFDVAMSLDGPAAINDIRRKTKNGRGTHRYLVDRIAILRRNKYTVRLLAVINPEATPCGKEIYRYFRSLGCTWMDFMYPICNQMANTMDDEISVSQIGRFYCDVFDAWIDEDNPDVYVRTLHDMSMLLLGGRTVTCHTRTDCSYVLTINTDGTVHVCDDLMSYARSELGHVNTESFADVESNERLKRLSRLDILFGEECRSCAYFPVCRGGCTLFRAKAIDDYTGRNYYCEAQQQTIDHIRRSFEAMAIKASGLECARADPSALIHA